jgi:hypothetical protein
MKKILLAVFALCYGLASAQSDSSGSNLTFSGYAEVYYTYDFNRPGDHNRPLFFTAITVTMNSTLNLGFVKAAYAGERVRANMALAAGTYMNANYAAEQGVLKNVYEANAGIKISGRKNIWIDAGIFASHIGFETAVSKDAGTHAKHTCR